MTKILIVISLLTAAIACRQSRSTVSHTETQTIAAAPPRVTPFSVRDIWSGQLPNYRGLVFGIASAEDAKRTLGILAECRYDAFRGETLCDGSLNCLDGNWCYPESLTFVDDKLVEVLLKFPADKYTTIRDIFITKFGQPVTHSEEVGTLMGVKAQNEHSSWSGGGVTISMDRYVLEITKGAVLFQLDTYAAGEREKARAKREAAPGKL